MADENVSQFGRDEYATYRETVTAAAEHLMAQVIEAPGRARNILRTKSELQKKQPRQRIAFWTAKRPASAS